MFQGVDRRYTNSPASEAGTGDFGFRATFLLFLIFGLEFFGSMTGGPMSVLPWAMYADTADLPACARTLCDSQTATP